MTSEVSVGLFNAVNQETLIKITSLVRILSKWLILVKERTGMKVTALKFLLVIITVFPNN